MKVPYDIGMELKRLGYFKITDEFAISPTRIVVLSHRYSTEIRNIYYNFGTIVGMDEKIPACNMVIRPTYKEALDYFDKWKDIVVSVCYLKDYYAVYIKKRLYNDIQVLYFRDPANIFESVLRSLINE